MHTTGILLGRITLPLVAAGMLLLGSLPTAQAADAFKMGVVDPQSVLEKSKSGQKGLGRAQGICLHQTEVVVTG